MDFWRSDEETSRTDKTWRNSGNERQIFSAVVDGLFLSSSHCVECRRGRGFLLLHSPEPQPIDSESGSGRSNRDRQELLEQPSVHLCLERGILKCRDRSLDFQFVDTVDVIRKSPENPSKLRKNKKQKKRREGFEEFTAEENEFQHRTETKVEKRRKKKGGWTDRMSR